MKRRDFIKFSATGLTVVAVGSMADWPMFRLGSKAFASSLDSSHLMLSMVEAEAEMVDGVVIPMWAFMLGDHDDEGSDDHGSLGAARIPGLTLVALEGDRIRMKIANHISQGGAHGFAIPGVTLEHMGNSVNQVTIPEGGEAHIEFNAPAAGTYMYLDPLNAPVNRVMGLHGTLVVLPNPIESNTPYSGLSGSSAVQRLFDDLGTTSHFPGNPWDPNRNVVWVFNVIDPDKALAATSSASALPASQFLGGFLPQYYTLNGKSGFFSAQHAHGVADDGGDDNSSDDHEHENEFSFADGLADAQGNISIRGTVGQPLVIRSLNPGLMWHSPHIHGNHVYPLSAANVLTGSRRILDNLTMLDTWTLAPWSIQEYLLPFIAPPDIPANFWARAADGENDELFPLFYPMHDHNEISNTAAGGNYPQGIATHWQIDGPFDHTNPATAVILIDKAEVRVKTGQLIVEGRCSVPNLVLDIHADTAGPTISNQVQVDAEGRFSFRGRALKALTSRFITIMHHDQLNPSVVHSGRTVPLRRR